MAGILSGQRSMLARAITRIESTNAQHRAQARTLLQQLLAHRGQAYRIGITGVPGVGKSTLIDQLGTNLTKAGHKVAVLAVDPTSTRSGGSILGDKTRMARLATNPAAFIRPSPTSGTLGGVARKTRETMALCEAAGFDVIIVETVGVGQSEVSVAEMVDFFLVLALPGAGDELQGIKKGVLEIADMIAVNKADGDNLKRATQAASDYMGALNILSPQVSDWQTPVITVSGKDNIGLDTLWEKIEEHRRIMTASGAFTQRRSHQAVNWMHDLIRERLLASLYSNRRVSETLALLELEVREGRLTPCVAADEIARLAGLGEQETE